MHAAIDLEVFRHRVSAVAEAMGAALQHAASSANIKERLDHSCAVFDGGGRLIAQAAHIPVHLGALPASVAAARRSVAAWSEGDIVALNHPYMGGSHLPDITTVSPVFAPGRGEPALFAATRAHHADVGGFAPGSLGGARDLFGEGLVLPPIHLTRAGERQADIISLICANSRTPEERLGDLEAQMAAHHVARQRLTELMAPDFESFARTADALLSYSSRRVRAALADLRPGTYRFEDWLEGDGITDNPLPIRVTLELGPARFGVDFSGTAPQTEGGVNMPLAVTCSAVYYVLACLVGDVPINAGMFDLVEVSAQEGTIVNPLPPAAVAAGNVETSQRVVDALLGALAQAAPERVPAASQGTMNNLTVGGVDPRTGKPFTYYETNGGGAGAGPLRGGASAVQVHMTNTRNTPVEALETAFPMRVESLRVRDGSGGAGAHVGGDGVTRSLRLLGDARVTVLGDRRRLPPWGLAGGAPGGVGGWRLVSGGTTADLPAKATFDALGGDLLVLDTPGGGGWGLRSAEDARQQVEDDQQRGAPGEHVEE